MLIVFVALVHLANAILGLLPDFFGAPLTLQRALGWIMAPVCWLMGIPWSQAVTAGGLMGIKTVLNELVAYLQLAALPAGALDPRSRLIMLYAHVRLRQFRLARHHDRGAGDHVPGAARRGGVARAEIDRLRHADDVFPRTRCSAKRCAADFGNSTREAAEFATIPVCSASLRAALRPGNVSDRYFRLTVATPSNFLRSAAGASSAGGTLGAASAACGRSASGAALVANAASIFTLSASASNGLTM